MIGQNSMIGRKTETKVLGKKERTHYIDIVKEMSVTLMFFLLARAPHSDFVLLFHMTFLC